MALFLSQFWGFHFQFLNLKNWFFMLLWQCVNLIFKQDWYKNCYEIAVMGCSLIMQHHFGDFQTPYLFPSIMLLCPEPYHYYILVQGFRVYWFIYWSNQYWWLCCIYWCYLSKGGSTSCSSNIIFILALNIYHLAIQIQINISFLFRIKNYLPCRDLNPGLPQ